MRHGGTDRRPAAALYPCSRSTSFSDGHGKAVRIGIVHHTTFVRSDAAGKERDARHGGTDRRPAQGNARTAALRTRRWPHLCCMCPKTSALCGAARLPCSLSRSDAAGKERDARHDGTDHDPRAAASLVADVEPGWEQGRVAEASARCVFHSTRLHSVCSCNRIKSSVISVGGGRRGAGLGA